MSNGIEPLRVRESDLSGFLLTEFERRCDLIVQKLADRSRRQDSSVVEIEARLGMKDAKAHFIPGVSKHFFQQMRDYFVKKVKSNTWMRSDNREVPVKYTHTDFVDVVFEDETRVTCELIRAKDSPKLNDIRIIEVMKKRRLGKPVDFEINSKINYNLRIGTSSEEPIMDHHEAYKSHVASAKKALLEAFNVSSRVKILGGIEMTIRREAEIFLYPPEDESQVIDPVYKEASRNNWKLSGNFVAQLKWTLLSPARLPSLDNMPNAELHAKSGLDQSFFVTNLPGIMFFDGVPPIAVYACQYIVQVKLADIFCGYGRFANVSDHADELASQPIKLFRRKERWTFKLRKNQQLDLTQTQQSANPVTLLNEPVRYEVELEHALDPTRIQPSSLRAVQLADGMLSDVFSRIYGTALPALNLQEVNASFWNEHQDKDTQRVESYERLQARKNATDEENAADQQNAADFYNKLNRSSVAARSDSMIYHMRCLNNFVKSIALRNALRRVATESERELRSSLAVLDLACGKGADLQKLLKAASEVSSSFRIDQYVGVDIARQSLCDAVDRLSSMRDSMGCKIRFIEADLGKSPLSDDPADPESSRLLDQWDNKSRGWAEVAAGDTLSNHDMFDLVSMQFAFHYMFQTEERIHRFFKTISKHTNVGGIFLATTVNADEMLRRLMSAGAGKNEFSIYDNFGMETCLVKFDDDTRERLFCQNPNDNSLASMIGLRYVFMLRDGEEEQAVAAPEWLIPTDLLLRIATVHNFKLITYERLPNYAASYFSDTDPNALHRKMNVLNHEGTLSNAEWDIASLYIVLELQKEDKPADAQSALRRLKERIPDFSSLEEAERDSLLSQLLANS